MSDRDLYDELEEFTGEFPEAWKPKVGDVIVGPLLRYDSGMAEYGEYVIAVVQDEQSNRARAVWLLHTVLLGEFKKKRPKPGERIGIKRLPDAEKGYKHYALRVDRDEPAVPDFAGFAMPADMSPNDQGKLLASTANDDGSVR